MRNPNLAHILVIWPFQQTKSMNLGRELYFVDLRFLDQIKT